MIKNEYKVKSMKSNISVDNFIKNQNFFDNIRSENFILIQLKLSI